MAKSGALDNIYGLQNIKSCNAEDDVTRDNSQRRFLAQHRVATLIRVRVPSLQRCVMQLI